MAPKVAAIEPNSPILDNSPEFKRLVNTETARACKFVERLTQDEVVDALRAFREVIASNRFPQANGITELRVLLSSLLAMRAVEHVLGRPVW